MVRDRLRVASIAALLTLALAACSTYRDDLARAKFPYNAHKYPQALALLEVLELDLDSLSKSERAEYAYYRGMSHFRLGETRHARHWLGRAAARDKQYEGRLEPDAKKRTNDVMADLNEKVWGGKANTDDVAKTCKVDKDCPGGHFCNPPRCIPARGAEPTSSATPAASGSAAPAATGSASTDAKKPEPAPKPPATPANGTACKRSLDCPGAEVCTDGVCKAPG